MDKQSAELVFNQIVASKRKLTIRDWNSDLFKEDKEEILKLIELGAIQWNETDKQLSYNLEEPVGDLKVIEFVKRDSISMRQDALKDKGNDESKGISLVCAYAQIKKHQYTSLSSGDEEFIVKIQRLFLE